MAEILLPPALFGEEDKVIDMCQAIGNYLGEKVECEKVISIRVKYPDNRPEIDSILKRLAGNKTGLRLDRVKAKTPRKIKYGGPRYTPDPLGS